jgi:transcriptional antiterminator RfaH
MPLLPLEPFVYPDDLLRSPQAVLDGPARWWALHTRPRAEKTLARKFLNHGLAFFLPLYQRQWRGKGRMHRSYLPLFAGYIFLHGDEEARLHALETNLVARWLPVPDQPKLHSDLARVYHLITAEVPLTPEDGLLPGTRVEITRGPLAGLEGTVLRRGKQLRVFVEVEFLQRGVSVEIESWMLEAVGR